MFYTGYISGEKRPHLRTEEGDDQDSTGNFFTYVLGLMRLFQEQFSIKVSEVLRHGMFLIQCLRERKK